MKLNPDCIRDILICVEDLPSINYTMTFDKDSIAANLKKYSYDDVIYHLRQCELKGFFYKTSGSFNGEYTVFDLSPAGHEFLANVRSDNVWENVKAISSKIGSTSLTALTQIATGVITAMIKNQLGI